MSDPDIRYVTTSDGVDIAYRTHGTGPPLVFVRGMNSHVVHMYTESRNRRFLEALSTAFSVTLFDMRGNGLSEGTYDVSLEGGLEDIRAVVDTLDAGPVTVFGQGWGSPFAIAFAAEMSERTERLVLYAGYAHGGQLAIDEMLIRTMREFPDAALAYMARASYPDSTAIPSNIMATLHATPEMAARYMDLARTVDVTGELARVRAPTLVVQPERGAIPLVAGQAVADAVADGRLVSIRSGAYNPWSERAIAPTLSAIGAFCELDIPTNVPHPMAVLATDMVSSTAIAHEVGDERALDLLRIHDDAVRSALRRHRGREIKHRGDGILAIFDDVEMALAASREAMSSLHASRGDAPVDVRIGVSYGEVFESDSDVYGTTVVLACRLAESGTPGGILVPEDVEVGQVWSGGELHTLRLKGFPHPVRVRRLGLEPR